MTAQTGQGNFDWRGWVLDVAGVCSTVPSARRGIAHVVRVEYPRLRAERDELLRLLANATDPENAGDWDEAREVGWAFVSSASDEGAAR